MQVPLNAEGRRSLRLEDMASANGIPHPAAHSAAGDAAATLALCRIARDADEETWSRFLKMSTKSAVNELLDIEDAVLHIGFRGNDGVPRIVAAIASDRNRRLCLPVTFDVAGFMLLDDDAAWARLQDQDNGMVIVEINKCPVLCPLYDAPEELCLVSAVDTEERARALRADAELAVRVEQLVQANQPDWSANRELEDRLYERLPLPQDDDAKWRFHRANWPERAAIARTLQDPRARAAALRIIHDTRPDLLVEEEAMRLVSGIRRRMTEEPGRWAWRTLAAAISGLEEVSSDARVPLEAQLIEMRGRFG